jgi:Protein of unknown function (DUF3016)
MRFISCPALLLATTAVFAVPATAGVKVTFADPSGFTDLDRRNGDAKRELRLYLQRLGTRLSPGLDLSVTILDINMAGLDHTVRQPFGPRIMTGSTFPSMRLRYLLTRKGKTIASGQDSISDQLYLGRPGVRSGDSLAAEKNLLDDWFRQRFSDQMTHP